MTENTAEPAALWPDAFAGTIYLGPDERELGTEIRHNMRILRASSAQLALTTPERLIEWVWQLVEDRRRKVRRLYPGRRATFYLWHDEQAGQLRFNVISDCHSRLPFSRARLNLLDSPDPIVRAFYHSPYLDGIPWSEFREVTWDEDTPDEPEPEPLDVFVVDL